MEKSKEMKKILELIKYESGWINMKGIDVSKHQGTIDWEKVKSSGVEFAIIRISYGQKAIDEKAIKNIEECIRVGIPFGVYTYSYALNLESAENEANLVINTLKPYKNKIQFPVIIDMEDADGYKTRNGMPTNETLVSICVKECNMFENAGYYAMIYASKSWFDTKLKSTKLDKYDKWIAWWNENASFDKSVYGIWQYTSKGKVNGISGNVDMNIAYKNYPNIIKNKDNPIVEETPDKTNLKYKVGETVKINGVYSSSTSSKKLTPLKTSGKITKIISDAKNPYLLNNGDIGWVNDECIIENKEIISYKVKKGDTLSEIAKKYNTTVSEIAKKNNIKDVNKIYVNQILNI